MCAHRRNIFVVVVVVDLKKTMNGGIQLPKRRRSERPYVVRQMTTLPGFLGRTSGIEQARTLPPVTSDKIVRAAVPKQLDH
jgi:hypothetical protein